MSEADIRAAFHKQAEWCTLFGAPFVARVCATLGATLDRSTACGRRILDWPGDAMADALMMRVTGGLHALARSGERPELTAIYPPHPAPGESEFSAILASALAEDRLVPWLETAPQTNEVGRSAVLMAGLKVVAAETGLPLRLFELGASAGLNLRLDRYRYRLGGVDTGPHDAPVFLAPHWSGPPPPDAVVEVVGRRGVDLSPIDLGDPAARERLLAYIWPDQRERLARTAAAIDAFAADPVALDTGDAAAWVEHEVAPRPGTATVVLHSIAFQYFPVATKVRIAAHLDRVGEQATAAAPLAWLRYEADDPGADVLPTLRLRLWPGGADRLLAHAHPHGASVAWLD